jgi:hypothetical protein
MSNVFRLPRQLHRLLTYLPKKAHLPTIRKTLRNDYNASDLTADEALLIAASLAYDKRGAALLMQESGKSAVQLVKENPKRKRRANWKRRFVRWLMRVEGSESFAAAHNRCQLPEFRKEIFDDRTSDYE